MVPAIHEILKAVDDADTHQRKIEILRMADSAPLRYFLKYALDPQIKWLLPEGEPPYKPNADVLGSEIMLRKEARALYLFCSGGLEENRNIKPLRREQKYIELLQSVHPEDAKLLIRAKDGVPPYPTVTAKLIREAYPGLLNDE